MQIKRKDTAAQSAIFLYVLLLSLLMIMRLLYIYRSNLLVEEAYYWNYAMHLDFSYLDHPPMVALLVKIGTLLFGNQEIGVRFATIPCYLFSMYFSYQLSNLIQRGSGVYALLLLSILPFFFIHSLIITPDIPLILSWSAVLYYAYKAMVAEEKNAWYWAGFWLGLGMLSKYTIVLLAVATLVYLLIVPAARKWFLRKEAYLAALIALILFSPVIYWNATHQWASFIFQGARRLQANDHFSTHLLLGLLCIYLTPAGVIAAWKLFVTPVQHKPLIHKNATLFIQIYSAVPIVCFIIFSLFHTIKINWVGPCVLALVPWLAALLSHNTTLIGISSRKSWLLTSMVLGVCYIAAVLCITSGKPPILHEYLFRKLLPWDHLSRKVHNIASTYTQEHHTKLIIIPLDLYNLGSELAFYQTKQFDTHEVDSIFPIIGGHIFGTSSLMYQYWGSREVLKGKTLLLISEESYRFNNANIYEKTTFKEPLDTLQVASATKTGRAREFYYKIVSMK